MSVYQPEVEKGVSVDHYALHLARWKKRERERERATPFSQSQVNVRVVYISKAELPDYLYVLLDKLYFLQYVTFNI
jgi:hypothetical protein